MSKYMHIFDLSFGVPSNTPDASDIGPDQLWAAIYDRFGRMTHEEIEDVAVLCDDATLEAGAV